jgi:predicted alpha-1,2-mannosidase
MHINNLKTTTIMLKKIFVTVTLISSIGFSSCSQVSSINHSTLKEPVDYARPLMGTMSDFELSNGNTYPAIALPWGMNFWTPQTGKMGDGWAYQYQAKKIRGFKQTHQPSPWMNDYGQFSIMPITGELHIHEDARASWYSHKSETVTPYYYSAYLADYDITTEIAPTDRAAWFRFTFPDNNNSYVIIDGYDRGSYIKIIPEENKIIGYTTRNSKGVPDNFKSYFIVQFDTPFSWYKVWSMENAKEILADKSEFQSAHVGAVVRFTTVRNERIHARVASSFISFEQAERNLLELNGDFEAVKNAGRKRWNEILGRIEVEGGTDAQKETFYTCLYRAVLFPRSFYEMDENGKPIHYSPYNGKVLPGYMFTDTGFWDTFRCLFPLLNLIYPSTNEKMQEGLLNAYKESGFYPEWASPGHRDCMVGNNSASVVADAIVKGIVQGDQAREMFEGLLKTANDYLPKTASGRLGYEYYNKLGYVPYDVGIKENAARTLEYAYNDWCIWQAGKKLGYPDSVIGIYQQRAKNYMHLFDAENKLMRGKNEDGTFQSPFSPFKWGDAFTEGNSLHYTWSVFHDIEGLINLMGGKKEFVRMLDTVFQFPPVFDDNYYGFVIHEIREMQIMNMGNYAHGNQPIQHMLYLYNYAGEPWEGQRYIRNTMDKLYHPGPDGYCGDEDNGQTSAWYVFSALGCYPVCPATDEYIIGSPLFRKVAIHLENGKKVVINAPENSADNPYVRSISLNGKPYSKMYFTYGDLLNGAAIDFWMSQKPNMSVNITDEDMPYSLSKNEK